MPPAPDSFRLTALLGALLAISSLAIDSTLPALPDLAQALGGGPGAAQFTLTAVFGGVAIGQLVWGPVSDRIGRRPAILAGLALFLVSSAASAAAPGFASLTALRFAQGFAVSCGPVLTRTVVRDLYAHEHAAQLLARVLVIFSIMPIAAPLIGSQLLMAFGWRAAFVLHALVAAAVLIAVSRGLPETAPADRAPPPARRIAAVFGSLLADRRFVAPYVVMLAAQTGIMAWVTHSAFALVRGIGVTPAHYALLFSLSMLGQISGAWASSRVVMGRGIPAMLRKGTRLALFAALVMTLLDLAGIRHWSAVVGPMLLYMFATSFIVPHATAAALSPFPHAAGSASSLIGAIQFAFGAAVGAGLGAVFDGTARPMIWVIAASAICSVLAERRLYRPLAARPR
ncbi:MAG: multidrug effflux MFS transporter [Betaproteobacteria bacterium]|nr:multidrug effflux MFS transporter [Betaproteobacteria bacterium]